MKSLGLACAIALCLACAPATGSPAEEPTNRPADASQRFYRQRVAEAHALYESERYGQARKAFDALLTDPLFQSLGKQEQRALLSSAAWSHAREQDLETAAKLYHRANALGFHDADDWYRLAIVEWDRKRHEDAARALTELVQRHPQLLPNIDSEFPNQLLYATEPDSDARLALMEALFHANWQGASGNDSTIWYQLALQHVIRGQPERARAPLARVEDPDSLVRIRSDRRFDALINRESWRYNVGAAAERLVQALRNDVEARPASLDARVQLGYALITANRPEALLALVDETIDRIAAAAPGSQPFEDMERQAWLLDHRARALRRLGRHEEALAELRRASQLTEGGMPNVSQILNLGSALCAMKRPREALDAIGPVGEMSGYGRTVQASVRHCAALQLGDAEMSMRELAYLSEHRDDSEVNYLDALLEAGKHDDAATYLIELLASPAGRTEALAWMQSYVDPYPLPRDAELQAMRESLMARADVRAALEPVGRIESYPIDGMTGSL